MRKLLISLSAIAMLAAGATVASAAGGYVVDYNEALSTAEKAVIDVYLDAESAEGFGSLACTLCLKDGTTDVTSTYVSSGTATPYGSLTTTQVKYASNKMQISAAGTAGAPITLGDNGKIGTFELTLKKALTGNVAVTYARATAYAPISGGAVGSKVTTTSLNEYDAITKVHYAAETVGTYSDGTGDAAVAYKVTGVTAGTTTPKWCAMDGTTAVENTATIPNVDGTTDFGLVVSGKDLSSVKFVW